MDGEAPSEYLQTSYMAKLIRKQQLNKDELAETMMFLLMAGVDTTGYIVNWLMINLAANPGPQELLRDELSAVLKGGDLESQHLESLPYLKACIRESHRLTPPGPIAMGRPTKSNMSIAGYE